MSNVSGQVVIITGSNTGVGYETAKSLVDMGAHVIMGEQRLRSMMRFDRDTEISTRHISLGIGSLTSRCSAALGRKRRGRGANGGEHLCVCFHDSCVSLVTPWYHLSFLGLKDT